jgi:large subunit ribosomal protein L13
MKTYVPKVLTGKDRKWYIIDAKDQVLGKLAVKVANLLRAKDKADFTPHQDRGDYVIVTNVKDVVLTGNKEDKKMYYSHSGYIGHLKATKFKDLEKKHPGKTLELAIRGMLPKNKLRKDMLSRLKIFMTEEHTFQAQKPETITL